jgi:hypothetical protein
VMRHPPSTGTAVVRIAAASEPASGSVRPKATSSVPLIIAELLRFARSSFITRGQRTSFACPAGQISLKGLFLIFLLYL